MYEKLTDRSRKIMQIANQKALELRQTHICTEHLLFALLEDRQNVACCVLRAYLSDNDSGVNVDELFKSVCKECLVGEGDKDFGKLPPSQLVEKVLKLAIEESKILGTNYVGTEHILLGLLKAGGLGCNVLDRFNVTYKSTLKLVKHTVSEVLHLDPHKSDKELLTEIIAILVSAVLDKDEPKNVLDSLEAILRKRNDECGDNSIA